MVKIVSLRHAETNAKAKDITLGRMDWPINENGIKSTKDLVNSKILDKYQIDMIISSPLERAIQTAQIISDSLHIGIVVDEHIVERDYGEMSGLSWIEFEKTYPDLAKVNTKIFQEYLPSGESIQQVESRVNEFIKKVKNQYDGKTILLVSHTGVIRILKRILDNKSVMNSRESDPDNLGIEQFIIK
jgi:broad specificity phosphatase PhoE